MPWSENTVSIPINQPQRSAFICSVGLATIVHLSRGFIKQYKLYIIESLYHRHSRKCQHLSCALYNVIYVAEFSAKDALASFVGTVESLGCAYPVVWSVG
jgi:hypothetical protein